MLPLGQICAVVALSLPLFAAAEAAAGSCSAEQDETSLIQIHKAVDLGSERQSPFPSVTRLARHRHPVGERKMHGKHHVGKHAMYGKHHVEQHARPTHNAGLVGEPSKRETSKHLETSRHVTMQPFNANLADPFSNLTGSDSLAPAPQVDHKQYVTNVVAQQMATARKAGEKAEESQKAAAQKAYEEALAGEQKTRAAFKWAMGSETAAIAKVNLTHTAVIDAMVKAENAGLKGIQDWIVSRVSVQQEAAGAVSNNPTVVAPVAPTEATTTKKSTTTTTTTRPAPEPSPAIAPAPVTVSDANVTPTLPTGGGDQGGFPLSSPDGGDDNGRFPTLPPDISAPAPLSDPIVAPDPTSEPAPVPAPTLAPVPVPPTSVPATSSSANDIIAQEQAAEGKI